MDAADFLGALQQRQGPEVTHTPVAEATITSATGAVTTVPLGDEPEVLFPTTEAEGLPAAEPVAEEQPQERITSDTTPSGIVVEYSAAPKRFYRVNGVEVPSVTSVLGVLDKPGLPWWGMRVGIAGVLELVQREVLKPKLDADTFTAFFAESAEEIEDLLTQHKLTVNHIKEQAGDRGSSVHNAFERWAKTGEIPVSTEFPEAEQGYVYGLKCFLIDSEAEPVAAEVMVGSAEHGYAGRYDIRLRIPKDAEMVVHLTPKGHRRDVIAAGVHLSDLKTSKGVYPNTHFRQLEAYEAASIECGYEPTDGRYVLHVTADGRYEYKRSTADFEDFLAVLEVYQSNERLKAAK